MCSSTGRQKCKPRKQSGLVISNKQTAFSTITVIYLILAVCAVLIQSQWMDDRRDNQNRNERSCCPLHNRTTWWTITQKSIAWLRAHVSVPGLRNNLSVKEDLEGFDPLLLIFCATPQLSHEPRVRMEACTQLLSITAEPGAVPLHVIHIPTNSCFCSVRQMCKKHTSKYKYYYLNYV